MEKLLAVYGTLKQGNGNHRYLRESKLLGTHVTEPKYTMHSLGGFPGVRLEGKTPITVEVYRVTNRDVLTNINSLEGYTGKKDDPENWYDCIEIDTPYGSADMYYFKQQLNGPVIKDGIW